ncbi:hypothetical protein [Nonomuraea sp. NPDC049141]|uniref:hypothetical protein n=1 Tax=Nonomuraea sp. NPDC049141 TaxID=3155500 RepID=UPI00340E03E9
MKRFPIPALEPGAALVPALRGLRPYVDLAEEGGPIHARVLALHAARMVSGRPMGLPFQGNPVAYLRRHLLLETRLEPYDCAEPEALPPHLRTPAWEHLCADVAGWHELPEEARPSVATLLVRLGFYRTVLRLIPEPDPAAIARGPATAALALTRANALYKATGPRAAKAALRVIDAVREHAPSPRQRTLAAVAALVHHARVSKDKAEVARRSQEILARRDDVLAGDDSDVVSQSALLRACSFGPFMSGDRETTALLLEECETLARQAPDHTEGLALLKAENLHAMLETRSREALWSGDWRLAQSRAQRLAEHDPLDSRVHRDLGYMTLEHVGAEAALPHFETAAWLGPPFTAVSWCLAGQCRHKIGDLPGALEAYLAGAAADPGSVTAVDGLVRTARELKDQALVRWGEERLHRLHRPAAPKTLKEGGRDEHP